MLFFLGEQLFRFLVLPHLPAADLARLGRTCKVFYDMAKADRRVRLHMLQYDRPSDVPYGKDLSIAYGVQWAYEGLEQLNEYGYTGEGKVLCYDRETNRFLVFNDFYGRGFESNHWDVLVEKMRNDTEFDFQWKFIEFPPLTGRQRYKVVEPFNTVHRGSCVWVSFKAKF